MTNAQKWVAAFLGLFLLLFVLSKVTEKEEEFGDEDINFYSDNSDQTEVKLDGKTLMNRIGCTKCHGPNLEGTGLGPNLYSAKEYWSKNKLIGYLRDPSSYNGDARFEAYKTQFRSLMPSYENVDVKELGIIADYLLSLEK